MLLVLLVVLLLVLLSAPAASAKRRPKDRSFRCSSAERVNRYYGDKTLYKDVRGETTDATNRTFERILGRFLLLFYGPAGV